MNETLEITLCVAAGLQLAVAVVNLNLARLMHWRDDLERLPLLVREAFYMHCWFISATLAIFAVVTWRFSAEMAAGGNPVTTWLAAGIGVFWSLRAVMQVAYYSSSHWRGNKRRTFLHVACLVIYGGFGVSYLLAAFAGGWTS